MKCRVHFLLIIAVCLVGRPAAAQVEIYPGTDIQGVVNSYGAGTTYILKAGVHSLQSVQPKSGDTYIGEPGTVMTGAIQLTNFAAGPGYWSIGGQMPQGTFTDVPECDDGYGGCGWSEALFIDNRPLQFVLSFDQLRPGTWYFDFADSTIYIADDPNGHVVERSIAPYAFYSNDATGVTIQGLLIEKYAVPSRQAAIQVPYGWIVQDSEIRLNHGIGIQVFGAAQILRNNIHDNGQLGVGMWSGDGAVVDGNEIYGNNWARFVLTNGHSEAGGTKFSATRNLTLHNNYVHDNFGSGLWSDGSNVNVVYDGNTVTNNQIFGIFHEVSYNATIINNTVKYNGSFGESVWNAQIFISNSTGVEVRNNTVEVDASVGNAIILFQDQRGPDCPDTTNNSVHDNTITFTGSFTVGSGLMGFWAYQNPEPLYDGSNRFESNHYIGASPYDGHWMYRGIRTWNEFQAMGQDSSGSVQ